MHKFKVAVLGATGMVGRRFITLLNDHPWFEVACVAASARSAGRTYRKAVADRWSSSEPIPDSVGDLTVLDAVADADQIAGSVDFAFCAAEMENREATRAFEDGYARRELPVISNNSAHRLTDDVPMMIPEINDHHAAVIGTQRARLGTKRGFVTVKPNCSIQCYVPALHPLLEFGLMKVSVCTYQSISGGSKTFETAPEILDNVIPFISGEEHKSEIEPLKIWGRMVDGKITPARGPAISAQCYRVATSDGHMAAVSVSFRDKPGIPEILRRWSLYQGAPQKLKLPSAPCQFLTYFEEEDRPQTRLDRDLEKGMGISIGRLRKDNIFDYKFVSLAHNTVRGAAGGGVLTAELLVKMGYIERM